MGMGGGTPKKKDTKSGEKKNGILGQKNALKKAVKNSQGKRGVSGNIDRTKREQTQLAGPGNQSCHQELPLKKKNPEEGTRKPKEAPQDVEEQQGDRGPVQKGGVEKKKRAGWLGPGVDNE